ncbi:MAG: serpin family protein [Lachnospiraceae bacterium]|nr:serpin family protein [Lachnospiraceae bacterium]
MKRLIAVILCITMLAGLTACAGNKTGGETDSIGTETDEPDTDEPETDEPETDEPETDQPEEPATVKAEEISGYMTDGINGTGTKLLEALYDGGKNVFISPLSISLDFGILYTGAAGDTKKAMMDYFGYADDFAAHVKDMHLVTEYLTKGHSGAHYHIANSIWINDMIEDRMNPGFTDTWKEEKADIFVEDFGDAALVDRINGWVKENTKGMIPEVLDNVGPEALMYLINAIYFEGKWYDPFSGDDYYKDKIFHASAGDIKVDYMARQDRFCYLNDGEASCVRIPYSDGMTSMYIILPHNGADPKDFITRIPEYVKETGEAGSAEVFLQLPKMKLKYSASSEIVDAMKNGGLDIIFSDHADFSEMADGGLSVGNVIHKTALEVDEDGTKAAAATVIEIKETAAAPGEEDEIIYMIVDSPFFLVIADDDTGMIIFEGYIQDPRK